MKVEQLFLSFSILEQCMFSKHVQQFVFKIESFVHMNEQK